MRKEERRRERGNETGTGAAEAERKPRVSLPCEMEGRIQNHITQNSAELRLFMQTSRRFRHLAPVPGASVRQCRQCMVFPKNKIRPLFDTLFDTLP